MVDSARKAIPDGAAELIFQIREQLEKEQYSQLRPRCMSSLYPAASPQSMACGLE